jgi:uncharacterized protein
VIDIVDCAEGCILPVRAQPGARRSGIVGEHNGAVKIAVAAPAEKGKANDAIQEILCDQLGLKRSQVQLLAGPASRDKRFLLRGITPAAVLNILRSVLERD